jgi:hypothetical protein
MRTATDVNLFALVRMRYPRAPEHRPALCTVTGTTAGDLRSGRE